MVWPVFGSESSYKKYFKSTHIQINANLKPCLNIHSCGGFFLCSQWTAVNHQQFQFIMKAMVGMYLINRVLWPPKDISGFTGGTNMSSATAAYLKQQWASYDLIIWWVTLHIHKENTDELSLESCLNEFVVGSEYRLSIFDTYFYWQPMYSSCDSHKNLIRHYPGLTVQIKYTLKIYKFKNGSRDR